MIFSKQTLSKLKEKFAYLTIKLGNIPFSEQAPYLKEIPPAEHTDE